MFQSYLSGSSSRRTNELGGMRDLSRMTEEEQVEYLLEKTKAEAHLDLKSGYQESSTKQLRPGMS